MWSAKGWKAVGITWLAVWLALIGGSGIGFLVAYVAYRLTCLVFFVPVIVIFVGLSVLIYENAASEGE